LLCYPFPSLNHLLSLKPAEASEKKKTPQREREQQNKEEESKKEEKRKLEMPGIELMLSNRLSGMMAKTTTDTTPPK
jgi:hypothetical protein